MFRTMILTVISCLLTINAQAETEQTEKLASITKDYAKCADVAVGNFTSDKQAQDSIRAFYKAMILNIKKLIALESEPENEAIDYFEEIMGREAFVGFLLKGYSDVDLQYQDEKKSLKEKYDFDWQRVHKVLWVKQGCNAIYSSLQK
ncbi:MAG: hypothetical protein GYB20_13505 [Oceanospirillales bacterium]|nr:hypothetical protein [Oceanospirillales bacterium]MBR9888695.1 hypothetical protein [Oceanospirillales bacterium]